MTGLNEELFTAIRSRTDGIVPVAAKAAAERVQARFILIDRNDYPFTEGPIKDDGLHDGVISAGSGPEAAAASVNLNPAWVRNRAINLLRLAEYLDDLEGNRRRCDLIGTMRRNQIAADLAGGPVTYAESSQDMQAAIDRIINLEDKLK